MGNNFTKNLQNLEEDEKEENTRHGFLPPDVKELIINLYKVLLKIDLNDSSILHCALNSQKQKHKQEKGNYKDFKRTWYRHNTSHYNADNKKIRDLGIHEGKFRKKK